MFSLRSGSWTHIRESVRAEAELLRVDHSVGLNVDCLCRLLDRIYSAESLRNTLAMYALCISI